MIGMKAPKNVSTARGSASGTPKITRPMPMKTASTKPMSACERMNPPRRSQLRAPISARWSPDVGPAVRRTQGRNFGPSLTNRNASTSASTALMTLLATVVRPVRTPVAICPALCWRRSTAACTYPPIWLAPRLNGGPCSQPWICWMPPTAPCAICGA